MTRKGKNRVWNMLKVSCFMSTTSQICIPLCTFCAGIKSMCYIHLISLMQSSDRNGLALSILNLVITCTECGQSIANGNSL